MRSEIRDRGGLGGPLPGLRVELGGMGRIPNGFRPGVSISHASRAVIFSYSLVDIFG